MTTWSRRILARYERVAKWTAGIVEVWNALCGTDEKERPPCSSHQSSQPISHSRSCVPLSVSSSRHTERRKFWACGEALALRAGLRASRVWVCGPHGSGPGSRPSPSSPAVSRSRLVWSSRSSRRPSRSRWAWPSRARTGPRASWNTKGGIEFPFTLGAVAAISGVADPGAYSLDRALGLPVIGAGAYVLVLVVGGVAYLVGSRAAAAERAKTNRAA